MAMSDGMGVMPVYNLDGQNNGGFGGDGGWFMMFLFFLLAWGGNGIGGFGANGAGLNTINNDFLYSNLTNQIGRLSDQNTAIGNGLQQGLCSSTYELANKIGGVQNAIEAC